MAEATRRIRTYSPASRSAPAKNETSGGGLNGLRKWSANGVMREVKALLIYLIGAASLVLGILASGNWALSEYHSLSPVEVEPHTTAVASNPEPAGDVTDADDPIRRPVWIEPTKKYVYSPPQVATVKVDPAPPVPTTTRPHGKTAAKPVRPRVAINAEARRAYGSAGQAPQLLILPLQHQAPN